MSAGDHQPAVVKYAYAREQLRAAHRAEAVSRRQLADTALGALSAFAAVAVVDASGGATAGGVYLLRAKERYNERVEAGAKSYAGLGPAVKNGDFALLAAYFAKDNKFDDLANPGFLLANAFRITSTQNPDKIPQVQKFKAFKADADALTAAVKKKKQPLAQEAFDKSLTSLAAYMDAVGLK